MTIVQGSSRVDAVDWLERLSPRELEVLHHVALGRSNAEIAAELYISVTTVKTHVVSLLRKVRARDRVQLVVAAWSGGLPGLSPARPARPTGRRAGRSTCASRSPRPRWR